ncbi:MAG: Crp/Fnr family transcriptional regulator [Dehalococcoidales bacterium]|nr:Crp/Fnr family transcriptional regulator [Dehalococcoidales bacterium]
MTPLNRTSILKQSLIFSPLEPAEIEEIGSLCSERRLKAGEAFFWEGDTPDWFYLLAVGKVKVVKHSSQGKEFIVAFFNPGEMFGEVAVFENRPYPATAQAVEDSVALGIKRDEFLKFLARRPEVALRIVNVLSGRLRMAAGRMGDLAGERAEQRLARTLLMLMFKLGNTLPFTRQEIADMSGTTTETAIRFMSRLNTRKITRSVRGKILILDELKLRLLADGPPEI